MCLEADAASAKVGRMVWNIRHALVRWQSLGFESRNWNFLCVNSKWYIFYSYWNRYVIESIVRKNELTNNEVEELNS